MKLYKLSGIFLILAFFAGLTACEDDTSTIGSSIAGGEVNITMDTFYFNLEAKAIRIENFDSKTGNLMIGNLQSDIYGKLNCSFVTRLMCASSLGVEDSLFMPSRVDSCKLILGAERSAITGDSLAPQKLAVYKLIKQLPSDINNTFDPQGYYEPSSLLAERSYTVSEVSSKDSTFYNSSYVDISVDLPVEFGREVFEKYASDPEIFQWPQTMAQNFLPGLYVKPTFGNGCVANIHSVYVAIFYHSLQESSKVEENGDTIMTVTHLNHMAVPFTVSPEVLSSNNISYLPAQNIIDNNNLNNGQVVITTPGGYIARYEFPAYPLIERYKEQNTHLSTVNDLILFIPAEEFEEESGIGVAQNLLMIKSTEYENFFKQNKTPDNLTSFTGVYDPARKQYYFTTMRSYFLDLLSKETISPEDLEFTLVPIEIETETVSSYYGEGTTYVTKCVPYTSKPTMTLLKTDEAMITFSFSTQMID